MSSFGLRLEAARRDRGISSDELAKVLAVSRHTYTNYEQGRSEPNHATVVELARILQVPVEWLTDDTPLVPPPHGQ